MRDIDIYHWRSALHAHKSCCCCLVGDLLFVPIHSELIIDLKSSVSSLRFHASQGAPWSHHIDTPFLIRNIVVIRIFALFCELHLVYYSCSISLLTYPVKYLIISPWVTRRPGMSPVDLGGSGGGTAGGTAWTATSTSTGSAKSWTCRSWPWQCGWLRSKCDLSSQERGCARTESLWVSVSSSSAESSVSSSYCEFSDAGSCDDSSVAPSFDLVSGLCRSIRSGSESFFSDSEICFLPRLIVLSPTVLLWVKEVVYNTKRTNCCRTLWGLWVFFMVVVNFTLHWYVLL